MENPTPWNSTRRKLPHFYPDDATYFVTYRLAHTVSSLERDRLHLLHPGSNAEMKEQAVYFQKYDFVLDAARHGPKFLAQPEIRTICQESFAFLDGRSLDLIAYTIMPNHVHFVAQLCGEKTLSQVMQSLKGFTAREANRVLGRTGTAFWQDENYDDVVRDGRLGNVVYYILMNPVKAGLVDDWRDWPGTYLSPNFYGLVTLRLKAR